MTRILKSIIILLTLLVGLYFIGPEPEFPSYDNTPRKVIPQLEGLSSNIQTHESQVKHLKEDNEARIVWADSTQTKTRFSIVYLHGFSASQGEGYPMHLNIADSLNANLYLSRLPEHGIDTIDAMEYLEPGMLVESAKDAIAVGKAIGEQVIVMGCSTGSTLGIYLAAGDPDIDALILLSPNIEVNVSAMKLATRPWGSQIIQQLIGEHRVLDSTHSYRPYWSDRYHTNGLIAMQALLDQTMKDEIFQELKMPVYCGYFFKNEETRDKVVSIDAILEFRNEVLNINQNAEFEAFDRGNHVLGSIYKNSDWMNVQNEVLSFINTHVIQ